MQYLVTATQAGIQVFQEFLFFWIPASAGTTTLRQFRSKISLLCIRLKCYEFFPSCRLILASRAISLGRASGLFDARSFVWVNEEIEASYFLE